MGELSKQGMTDEDGKTIYTYTNQKAQTLLKRTQLGAGVWADTYYIYDYLWQLRLVIQPEALNRSNEAITHTNDGTYEYIQQDYTITQADAD